MTEAIVHTAHVLLCPGVVARSADSHSSHWCKLVLYFLCSPVFKVPCKVFKPPTANKQPDQGELKTHHTALSRRTRHMDHT